MGVSSLGNGECGRGRGMVRSPEVSMAVEDRKWGSKLLLLPTGGFDGHVGLNGVMDVSKGKRRPSRTGAALPRCCAAPRGRT